MKKGMTLIEILAIIALISIIVGIGISALLRYQQRFGTSAEINELVDDLHYAKQMSITEQIHHGIRFNFHENYYEIIKYGSEEEVVKIKKLPFGIELENIDNYFETKFTFFGAVFKGGKIKIKDYDFSKIIEIKPSGFIHVQGVNSD